MNAQRQTNTFQKGMNCDLDYSVIDSGQYQWAENIRIIANDNSSTGVMQNIEGVRKLNPTLTLNGETIVHTNTIRDWAIVFTKKGSNFNIYRYDFGASETEPIVTTVASNVALDIPIIDGHYAVSSVCKWESDDLVKIYWCDGVHQIRVLNVATTHPNLNVDSLNISPKSQLPPLFFKGLGTGGLKAGKYQYCYQLFNPRTSETSISVLSPIITVSRSLENTNSQDIYGSSKEETTNRSIKLQTTVDTNSFSRARIISIYYSSNTAEPVITVIDEISISNNTLVYEDKGGSVIDELTLEEFNGLSTYIFTPKVIESKDNMLFAANITEQTWDISDDEFDARAYRCNKNGQILLTSTSGQDSITFSTSEISTKDIPTNHDCICPANYDDTSQYLYAPDATGKYVYGGIGKNISYRFIKTNLIESDAPTSRTGFAEDSFSLNSKARSTSTLDLYNIEEDGSWSDAGSLSFADATAKVLNYSNSEVESMARGYMRDEIYRFAIVFYNEENVASSAHWIADIRMPKASAPGYNIFTSGMRVDIGGSTTNSLEVVTHPLGVQFTVNIPSDLIQSKKITGYEIVRCERTISDRTILMQGAVSCVCNYDNTNQLTAFPYLTYSTSHGMVSQNNKYAHAFDFSSQNANEYFLFISPEICVNRTNASEVTGRATEIKGIYRLRSSISPDESMGNGTPANDKVVPNGDKVKVLVGAKASKHDLKNITSNTGTSWAKNSGWAYTSVTAIGDSIKQSTANNAIYMGAESWYDATLAKYYNKITTGGYNSASIQDITIATNTEPFDLDDDAWRTKATNVGSMVYYNWVYGDTSKASDYDDNNVRKVGPHGVCAIFQSTDMTSRNTMVGEVPELAAGPESANAILIANLRQSVTPYGGNSYATRQNSVYIGTGSYVNAKDNSNTKVNVFGGDTYVGVLDYANCMFAYHNASDNYEQPDNERIRAYNGAYIPLESSINLSLRTDTVGTAKTYESGTGYANHFVENDIVQVGSIYVQNTPLYAYNDAYSAQPRAKNYVSKSIYSIDNLHTDTRVMNSEPKTNLEVTDSWTKFRVANYLDVDTRFGSINNLKLFKNNLLFWQTDAFGTLAVNERSLIQDNNVGALTLGTGGVLTRFDYFTTKNGSKENQLRTATQSDSTVYWYDADRNEICGFDNQLRTVSKLKGVQSYLHDNKDIITNDPISVYDKKYNEVLLTLEDKTLVFNEQVGAFTSFYTYRPDWYAEFTDKLMIYKNLSVYKYNSGNELDMFTGKDKVSYVRFIVNDKYPQTKTFDNVEYGGDFTYDTNFDNIYFETKRQTSFTLTQDDIDYREDTYKFCVPRSSRELNEAEELVNKSYRDRMKGKYLICHYKYDCNDGNTFKVPYISTAYRYSLI